MPVQPFELEIYPALGMNTALNPAQLPQGAQRRAYDACMRAVNTIGKRDGSAPVTDTALPNPLTYLIPYKSSPSAVAPDLFTVSGTTLYKLVSGVLTPQTMTNAFTTSSVFGVGVTDMSNTSVMALTDGGSLKQYNGTAVANVTAAANDTSPAPPNDLANINAKGPKYIWVHTGHVFMSAGTDLIWYSKRYTFNYFPNTQYFRYVKNNDYITGPGITFNGMCLIPMRRGWGVLLGEVFDDGQVSNGFKGNQYLNTVNGNIAARGYAKATYPTGQQTLIFLSDDGVHEIYDTGFADDGVRQYSTRSLMKDKIDFMDFGFTEAEKTAAVAFFDADNSRFLLSISRGSTNYVFAYDTRNQEWYIWRLPRPIQAFSSFNSVNYFGSTTGHLYAFSKDLYSDWDDKAKTTGTPIDFDVYSGLLSYEFSGDGSYLHYYLVEAQMYQIKSSLDVYLIYGNAVQNMDKALLNQIFVWGVTGWNEGQWANLSYTDTVNNAKRLVIHKKAKYFQRRWRNNRDEPTVILKEKFQGTISGR